MFHTQDNRLNQEIVRSASFYKQLEDDILSVIDGEPNLVANLANISAVFYNSLSLINWAGFYLWDSADKVLILGPFQGKPACIRIKSGKGVCGTAVETGKTQLVADVHQFPGHIACDSASNSEIVVPIFNKKNELVGVLDIDSPILQRFNDEDKIQIENLVHKFSYIFG